MRVCIHWRARMRVCQSTGHMPTGSPRHSKHHQCHSIPTVSNSCQEHKMRHCLIRHSRWGQRVRRWGCERERQARRQWGRLEVRRMRQWKGMQTRGECVRLMLLWRGSGRRRALWKRCGRRREPWKMCVMEYQLPSRGRSRAGSLHHSMRMWHRTSPTGCSSCQRCRMRHRPWGRNSSPASRR